MDSTSGPAGRTPRRRHIEVLISWRPPAAARAWRFSTRSPLARTMELGPLSEIGIADARK
jgi:hypothetical protein